MSTNLIVSYHSKQSIIIKFNRAQVEMNQGLGICCCRLLLVGKWPLNFGVLETPRVFCGLLVAVSFAEA